MKLVARCALILAVAVVVSTLGFHCQARTGERNYSLKLMIDYEGQRLSSTQTYSCRGTYGGTGLRANLEEAFGLGLSFIGDGLWFILPNRQVAVTEAPSYCSQLGSLFGIGQDDFKAYHRLALAQHTVPWPRGWQQPRAWLIDNPVEPRKVRIVDWSDLSDTLQAKARLVRYEITATKESATVGEFEDAIPAAPQYFVGTPHGRIGWGWYGFAASRGQLIDDRWEHDAVPAVLEDGSVSDRFMDLGLAIEGKNAKRYLDSLRRKIAVLDVSIIKEERRIKLSEGPRRSKAAAEFAVGPRLEVVRGTLETPGPFLLCMGDSPCFSSPTRNTDNTWRPTRAIVDRHSKTLFVVEYTSLLLHTMSRR